MAGQLLVQTIRERCRTCYTCVRECPAKAIRVAEGQAEVVGERCIGCGNCVRVCSQNAKRVLDGIEPVRALLAGGRKVAACLAPSFPAEFTDWSEETLAGLLRKLGFAHVHEVAFGADLVARRYRQLMEQAGDRRYIASTCPGIVAYVGRYHPDLAQSLAPVVSPMAATARVARRLHGDETAVVFIGPCIAKKGELGDAPLAGDVDAALTFGELRRMIEDRGLSPASVAPSQIDEPRANMGGLFAVSRGLLQTADIAEDLVDGRVVTADGRSSFVSAIREFEEGHLDARLLETLCCHGCIMGAGMSTPEPLFSRRRRISDYVRERGRRVDKRRWQAAMDLFADVDLSRSFAADDQRIPVPFAEELAMIMERMGKRSPDDELNCGACGYDTCREHAMAIFKGLAETQMCLPHTIDSLDRTIKELNESNRQLTSAQEALMQSEKLASMGQLAAGVAHEVNNPLGVVLMYAHLLMDDPGASGRLRQDLAMIAEQADRCKRIVSQLLHFARQNQIVLQDTDLRDLVRRAMKALPPPAGVRVYMEEQGEPPLAPLDADQIVQVFTNLVSNAYAAMPAGGTLTIRTRGEPRAVFLEVQDTGTGISTANMSKIFEPFFTTKQMGKGTGLGLAVTYGIVKMHRGDILVRSNANPSAGPTGSTFTVSLPRERSAETPQLKEMAHGQDSAGG
jgi:signal transduction histidine kinase/iron only hydrogenase large subunit-like protein